MRISESLIGGAEAVWLPQRGRCRLGRRLAALCLVWCRGSELSACLEHGRRHSPGHEDRQPRVRILQDCHSAVTPDRHGPIRQSPLTGTGPHLRQVSSASVCVFVCLCVCVCVWTCVKFQFTTLSNPRDLDHS